MTTTKNSKVATTKTDNLGWAGIMPALLKAQIMVEKVEKDTQGYQYKYATAESMYLSARAALHENNIVVFRKSCEILTHIDTEVTKGDVLTANYGQKMIVVYVVYCGQSWVECPTEYPICVKGGMSDKALNASLTTCLAYFLRDLLLIPRCDEEVDQRPDTIAHSGTRTTPKPKGSGKSNKQTFMANVGQWINRDIAESDTAEACIILLKKNDLPVDGSATSKQFKEIADIVSGYIDEAIEPATILSDNG